MTQVQILDNVCISLQANAFEKGMNPFVLPTSYENIVGQTRLFLPWLGNQARRRKTLNSNQCYSA